MITPEFKILVDKLAEYSKADQDKILTKIKTSFENFIPDYPSFTIFMGQPFKNNFTHDHTLIETGPEAQTGMVNFTLTPYLEDDESGISGDILTERAKNLGGFLGQKDGEKIIEFQDFIPIKYRSHYIIFPATLYAHRSSNLRCIPIIKFDGVRWIFGIVLLNSGFSSIGRLLVPSKQP